MLAAPHPSERRPSTGFLGVLSASCLFLDAEERDSGIWTSPFGRHDSCPLEPSLTYKISDLETDKFTTADRFPSPVLSSPSGVGSAVVSISHAVLFCTSPPPIVWSSG